MSALLGPRIEPDGVTFGAYATTTDRVAVSVGDRDHPLEPVGDGYFAGFVPGIGPGARYWLVLGDRRLPDPYGRFLPEGVHGPAEVVSDAHEWRHPNVARPLRQQVIYELHVGTFTPEGTYAAAASKLGALVDLGVTTLELMPLSAFAGSRGWGYDGVSAFAPFAPYGRPEELRAFVDAAHAQNLGVLLDVVYNHLGPSGAYLRAFSERYFRSDLTTPWGEALDYRHAPTRRWLVESGMRWLEDYRFDGLRLDATFAVADESPIHVLRELAAAASRQRRVLIAEDDRNDPRIFEELGADAVWADDFHHQVRVTLTGERHGYYAGYTPGVAGIAGCLRRGWIYEGQTYAPWGRWRGHAALGVAAEQLVYCVQNHDQVGNRARGDRLHHGVPLPAFLAVQALLLTLPAVPLLFMGQEWAASSPFLYFTDHEAELGRQVTAGRRAELSRGGAAIGGQPPVTPARGSPLDPMQIPFGASAVQEYPWHEGEVPDPQAVETFLASKLRWEEREHPPHAEALASCRAWLALRRQDPVLGTVERSGLRAEARGDLLVVEMRSDQGWRRLLANLSGSAISVPPELRGGLVHPVEASLDPLPPWGVVLLAP